MSIKEILSTVLRVPLSKISDDAARGKLRGWDSMGHIAVISELEKRFAIRFEQSEILRMTSLSEITTVLRDKGVTL